MNTKLKPSAFDACLEVLYRGLLCIRTAGWAGDAARAAAVADALHNLPHLLSNGDEHGWTVERFETLFVDGLEVDYPDIARELRSTLHRADLSGV
jgi:hypothetical protein